MFYKIGLKNRKNKNEFNLYNKLVSFANKIFVLLGLRIKNLWLNAKTTLNTSARRKLPNLSTRTEFRQQIQVTIISILKTLNFKVISANGLEFLINLNELDL